MTVKKIKLTTSREGGGPVATVELEPMVLRHALAMQHKLDKNRAKPCRYLNPNGAGRTHVNLPCDWLLMRARQELDELERALTDFESAPNLRDPQVMRDTLAQLASAVAYEAADVANFVMFTADNALAAASRGKR